jgi:eukaryotic-like serine/threonine-protein kinase
MNGDDHDARKEGQTDERRLARDCGPTVRSAGQESPVPAPRIIGAPPASPSASPPLDAADAADAASAHAGPTLASTPAPPGFTGTSPSGHPGPMSALVDSFIPNTVTHGHQRVLDGKYALERRLGEGGMGAVYVAQHVALRHLVAIKVMHGPATNDETAVRRFLREARAMAALDHPNIVRVLDFGVDQGAPYIAMDYLKGKSLDDMIAECATPPPLARVRDILVPVLDGLAAVHERGVVHRDLKPDNIFLAESPSGEQVKLVDFGLARMDDGEGQPSLTQTSAISGTPDYMSPEQCQSLKVGPETDIYAVGCILTALLQLFPPFSGGSVVEVLTKQMFTAPPPLQRPTNAEPVPAALEALRLSLLAKDKHHRPQSALEVKARLLETFDETSLDRRLTTRRAEAEQSTGHRRSAEALAPSAPALRAEGTCLWIRAAGAAVTELTTPLSTQGIALTNHAGDPHGVVLFEAGDDLAVALEFLSRRAPTDPPSVVSIQHLDVARINALIAAGAADSIASPPDPSLLAKKLGRVLRRKR